MTIDTIVAEQLDLLLQVTRAWARRAMAGKHEDGLVLFPSARRVWSYWCPHCGRDVHQVATTIAEVDAMIARHGLLCPGLHPAPASWITREDG
jgi:hypothetical protein